jgi:hypothetical protein
MDLRSLNSGSVDSKGWLNPVCGSLSAATVGAPSFQITDEDSQDTVQLSGGIYRRAASTSAVFTLVPAPNYANIALSNVQEGDIPTAALVAGCSYELYIAGRFTDGSPGSGGGITIYPGFLSTQPTGPEDSMCEIIVDSGATASIQGFEARLVFRIVSFTDTSVSVECTWSSMSNAATTPSTCRVFTNTVVITAPTPSRAASVTKRLPFSLWAKGDGGNFSFTRTQLFLRRIS